MQEAKVGTLRCHRFLGTGPRVLNDPEGANFFRVDMGMPGTGILLPSTWDMGDIGWGDPWSPERSKGGAYVV